MAKANWVLPDTTTGSGDKDVSVSATSNTGRNARNSVLTFTAANVDDTYGSVAQAGLPEYVDMADSASSEKSGKTVTIAGKSNSSKLTFSLGSGSLEISLPSSYTANSVSTANGAAITGDPGASAEYNFSISIVVPANTGIEAVSRQIIVTDNAGNQDTCTLTLAAGDAYLTISPEAISLDWQGNPVTIHVSSNTTWEIR